jgi:hypothetical protein
LIEKNEILETGEGLLQNKGQMQLVVSEGNPLVHTVIDDSSSSSWESAKRNSTSMALVPLEVMESTEYGDPENILANFNLLKFIQRELPFSGGHSENVQGMGLIEDTRETRIETPPNIRKHGRATPDSESPGELTPKRMYAAIAAHSPMGTPPEYKSTCTTPRSESTFSIPQIDPVKFLELRMKHDVATMLDDMRNQMENNRLLTEKNLHEILHKTQHEMTQQVQNMLGHGMEQVQKNEQELCANLLNQRMQVVMTPEGETTTVCQIEEIVHKSTNEMHQNMDKRMSTFE